jgi:hypothetical protein
MKINKKMSKSSKLKKMKYPVFEKIIPSLVAGSGIVSSAVTKDPFFLISIPAAYGLYKMAKDDFGHKIEKSKKQKLKRVI